MISKLTKFLLAGFFIFLILFAVRPLLAEEKVVIYFFYGRVCPHCAREAEFLDQLEEKYSFLEVKRFEVTENYENSQLLKKIGQRLNTNVSGVPFAAVHEKTFIGYLNDETTGNEIEKAIKYHFETNCPDPIADLFLEEENQGEEKIDDDDCQERSSEKLKINLPVFGEIDPASFSLPILTVLIAAVDGFNPCAMWVLLFLISLLLGMKDRKRMWLLGTVFVFTSGLVYFLFLSAWLNLFLFIGFIIWVRFLIGAVAMGSGAYHLREFWVNRTGACKVVGQERKKKTMEKMRAVTRKKGLFAALLGIILLAFAVNLIELVCSAGLPAVYTQVLSLAKLSPVTYYSYLFLYIFVFILDDLVVFIIAMKTLHVVGVTGKYSRYSGLIGGVIIFTLGVLLIFKPEWVMFG